MHCPTLLLDMATSTITHWFCIHFWIEMCTKIPGIVRCAANRASTLAERAIEIGSMTLEGVVWPDQDKTLFGALMLKLFVQVYFNTVVLAHAE
mmetsp:Transcript_77059/g.136474  ORF Transcript_77059/g.136474 Transcript_77059/m.136474 type:complete len:93 (+) Transcript_77059:760-1038(+)